MIEIVSPEREQIEPPLIYNPAGDKIWDLMGVSFDLRADTQIEGVDSRFLLGCFNRCFCNWESNDLIIQPKRSVSSNADNHML